MFRFTALLISASVLLCGLTLVGVKFNLFTAPSYYLQITLYIAVITFVRYRRLVAIDVPDDFVRAYLLSISVHLVLLLSFIAFVLYTDRPSASQNAVYFLGNCLVFIGLEVQELFLKKN